MSFKTTRLKPHACAHCAASLDAASTPFGEDGSPEPGDATLCVYCGEWNIFETHVWLRKPTGAELADLNTTPKSIRMREAWLETMRTTGKGATNAEDDKDR